ncbi:MAG: stage V sporulation T C-terminal domain-containing protein [Paraclostridium sp.]|uniref:stage V sporulation T C-terminal domain-containing protein n=1 Tax=Paraclostridium sp. TaxID=2023273 RepID=UPI003F36A6D8
MKATGIIRRIDDLGRIVIPKEIRKTLRIREGDPLEIFTAKNGEVILKKYSLIGQLRELAQDYAETLGETLGHGIVITDLDSIIAISKLSEKEYKGKQISTELKNIIINRASCFEKIVPLCECDLMDYSSQIVTPIISCNGDLMGSICLVSKGKALLNESDEKLLKVAAKFLGKQVQ